MLQSLLLNFDDLVELAKKDPHALERLRQQTCHQWLALAPTQDRRKLNGLQFKIDMSRQRSQSNTAHCMQLYQQMNESFMQLKTLLSQTQDMLPHDKRAHPTLSTPTTKDDQQKKTSADVIHFPNRP